MSDDNITQFPGRIKPKSDAPLKVVYSHGCRHVSMLIDDKKAQVECADDWLLAQTYAALGWSE